MFLVFSLRQNDASHNIVIRKPVILKTKQKKTKQNKNKNQINNMSKFHYYYL